MTQPSKKALIRLFEDSDLEDIMRIETQSFEQPWSPNMFEALFHINPEGFYVVSMGGQIVGFAVVLFEREFGHTKRLGEAHLMNVAVDPSYRGKGLGTALLDTIIGRVRRAGLLRMRLEVRASNSTAISFYLNMGFMTVATVAGFYGDEDGVIMMKDI